MLRGGALAALLLAAGIFGCAPVHAASAVQVRASFDQHARLGGSSALNLGLHVDTSRELSPVTAVRLDYARGLGVVSSGLGLATCSPPPEDFAAVLVDGSGLGGCPPNAVMAYGTARANVRLIQNGQLIPEYATLTVLAGPLDHGHLKLVIYIDGQRPFGAHLVLAGEAVSSHNPYGGALVVRFPQVASLQDLATITLTDLQLSVGSPRIRYIEHGHSYRPDGIALPDRCPASGFQFAASLEFRDGGHRDAQTSVPCASNQKASG